MLRRYIGTFSTAWGGVVVLVIGKGSEIKYFNKKQLKLDDLFNSTTLNYQGFRTPV
jgi:hypothetical protein